MNIEAEEVRYDKWLWCVRLFKTRSLAIDAFKKNRILISGVPIKASREVKIGDIIEIKDPPIVKQIKVKNILTNRVSAKLVVDFLEDLTAESEYEKLKIIRSDPFAAVSRGHGRPSKKERKSLEKLLKFD